MTCVSPRARNAIPGTRGGFRFQRVTDADIDFGRRLRQTYYTANARGEHMLTGKTFDGVGARAYRAEYSGGLSSTDLRGNAALDYQIAPKTRIGLGAAAGYLLVGSGADQSNQYERNDPSAPLLGRRDDFGFVRAGSSFDFTRWGTLELSYEHRDNASTLRPFDFQQNLVGFAASFLF